MLEVIKIYINFQFFEDLSKKIESLLKIIYLKEKMNYLLYIRKIFRA